MMLKHSRWSGRRLMPSGGGWMTPNSAGGVAACLVWNKDDQSQSDWNCNAAFSASTNALKDDAEQSPIKPATCADVKVSTSITVVPQKPTFIICPSCACGSCPHHNATTHSCVSGRCGQSHSKVSQLAKSRETTLNDQMQDAGVIGCGGCCCCTREPSQRHPGELTVNDGYHTKAAALRPRHHEKPSIVVNMDGQRSERRRNAAESWSQHHRDSNVNIRTQQHVLPTCSVHRRRDLKYNVSTGKVTMSPTSSSNPNRTQKCRTVSRQASRPEQSSADLASWTDHLTSNIYASISAFQDEHESDVTDAVHGCLHRQPSSSPSFRRRRPPAAVRRPATAADDGGSRTVELRQGDVGPLSSLVIIRPATPQPRTGRVDRGSSGPAGRPRTATGLATICNDERPRAAWNSSSCRLHHQQRFCANRSSSTKQQFTT